MPSDTWNFGDAAAQNGDERSIRLDDVLTLAQRSDAQGRQHQALYLYLAAFEIAQEEFQGSFLCEGHPALAGLHRAWDIACELEDHSLAAHILDILEPYLTLEELGARSARLERLALSGFGMPSFSGKDDDDVASLLTQDLIEAVKDGVKPGLLAQINDRMGDKEPEAADAGDQHEDEENPLGPGSCRIDDLYGYDEQLKALARKGVFTPSEEDEFMKQMFLQHGLEAMPSRPVLVFRSEAREDADRLMLAVAAELHRPTIRMRVDDNGITGSVLCVIAANGYDPRNAWSQHSMGLPDVLVLEGVDSWANASPAYDSALDDEMQAGMTRGAVRAIAMIRAAIDNPHVAVFASVSANGEVGSMMEALLGSVEFFDVDAPDDDSRDALWDHLMDAHPSLSALDRFELVRLSEGMCRCDIEAAAREAVQQAFEESVAHHEYQPVTRGNILDKIAAYQPLASKQYREIEDSLVEDLMSEIERFLQSNDGI